MGLTINNSQTLHLLNVMNGISDRQNDLLNQLTTGKRINKGSDDPAGMVAVSGMNAELTAVNAAIDNGQQANSMLDVADGALGQVSSLLSQIETLAASSTNDAGLSASQIAANQAQIDQAINGIDQIIGTTTFNGKRLLDGSQGINTTGVDTSKVNDVRVYSRDSGSTDTSVSVSVTAAAAKAKVTGYATTSAVGATKISITGTLGTAMITIASSEHLSSIQAKINAASAQTGVVASTNGANLSLLSTTYGSAGYVMVQNISGDATHYGNQTKTTGADAKVSVNGQVASVDGLDVNFNGGGTSLSFTLSTAYNTAGGATTFQVTDGGATFQLGTDLTTRSTIGITSLFSDSLGSSDVGYLASVKSGGANSATSDAASAVSVIKKAIEQVLAGTGTYRRFPEVPGTDQHGRPQDHQGVADGRHRQHRQR